MPLSASRLTQRIISRPIASLVVSVWGYKSAPAHVIRLEPRSRGPSDRVDLVVYADLNHRAQIPCEVPRPPHPPVFAPQSAGDLGQRRDHRPGRTRGQLRTAGRTPRSSRRRSVARARRRVTDAEVVTLCVAQTIMGIPSGKVPGGRRQATGAYFKRHRRLTEASEWLMGNFASQSPGFADDLLRINSTRMAGA